jgi:uncharacterized protein YbdZ (MbtH family)
MSDAQRDWRVLKPEETEHSLEGTCLLCPDGWRPTSHGSLVDVAGTAWAHLECVAANRGELGSTQYLNGVLDGQA